MSSYKFIINSKYSRLESWLRRLPEEFDHTGELIYDKRNKVRLFSAEGRTIVVKKYKLPYFHQRIDYTFIRPSKARRAYLFGLKLSELNIDTPEPIACIEEYSGGLFRMGYFVSAFIDGTDCRILRERLSDCEWLVRPLVEFIAEMHGKGFLHGDLNLTNILYKKTEEGGFSFSVIDINRSRFVSNPTRNQCLFNMVRLTHERPTMVALVREYASVRGWNQEECVAEMMILLDEFESPKWQRPLHALYRFFKPGR